MNSDPIIIGSRGSDLALWQAHFLQNQLSTQGIASTIKIITTQGDRIQDLSFDKMEGKGFFTKELEDALLRSEIDLAVHSYKDLETTAVPGLIIAGNSYRAHPSDLLIRRKSAVDNSRDFGLKHQAIIGTSSARRKMQVLKFRPDIELADLRGNVPTRVEKLRSGNYDAIILAKAGLDRLNLELTEFDCHVFDPTQFIPAPAQGVLAYQIRESDQDLAHKLGAIHHPEIAACIGIERKVLQLFQGGCQLPLGAYCLKQKGEFSLYAVVASTWHGLSTSIQLEGDDPDNLAKEAVNQLKANLERIDSHNAG